MRLTFGTTVIILAITFGAAASGTSQQSSNQRANPDEQKETIELRGELVEVPVVVRDSQNRYIPDLKKEDFIVYENGVEQQVTLFAHAEEPFHVALVLDTSGSTEAELPRIQQAALSFVQQLHPNDRVMIVSFDDDVRVENEFTSDREVLAQAIRRLHSGASTHLYDAVYTVVEQRMSQVKGRKAMILFTDGVDTASNQANEQETLHYLEESNVLVYSIRYDTREAVRRQLRRPKTINIETIPIPIPAPQPDPSPPDRNPPSTRWPQRWPSPFPSPWPGPNPYPDPSPSPYPDRYPTPHPGRYPVPPPSPEPRRAPEPTRTPRPAPDPNDPLEMEYQRGKRYLWDLSDRTGGAYYEANLLDDLPGVFQQIAEELRRQYTLGYYPSNTQRENGYRRIRVKVNRPGAHVRARPGYRAS
ncbi:MAG: VWA domain-containing protein [Acidobacteria bacterium]|nr:VWA domain-containing protein [Acidobacteriota bacterium]